MLAVYGVGIDLQMLRASGSGLPRRSLTNRLVSAHASITGMALLTVRP